MLTLSDKSSGKFLSLGIASVVKICMMSYKSYKKVSKSDK